MHPRRRLLIGISAVNVLGAIGIAVAGPAHAAKASKRDFAYQDKPKDGKRCADCRQFTPTASEAGACAVIEGEVSANGWCMAYAPRQMSQEGAPPPDGEGLPAGRMTTSIQGAIP